MVHQQHLALARFIEEVSAIVAEGTSEAEITSSVSERLRILLAESRDFIPAEYQRADEHRYVMYPLYIAPDSSFSIASAVWNVGQVTPIHDHGTWGVIGIYDGVEHEVRYRPPAAPGIEPPTYLDEGELRDGEVVVCCTTDQDVHEVSCSSEIPCVAVHVYGGDIGVIKRRAFDKETGAIRMFVSAWAEPVLA